MEELKCLLLLTPSLVHLKLVSSRSETYSIFDGSYWEQFIQNNLLLLNKFQFFFTYITDEFNDTNTLDSLILPFRSSFWLNNKHWLVSCDYTPRKRNIRLYTSSAYKDIEARSSKLLISSINPKCRMILHSNEDMDHYSRKETLTILRLRCNGIGDIGAQYLADALRNHQIITKLHLSGNKIGYTGAQHLAEALRNNETITELNLSLNKIGDTGAQHLAKALRNNKTITELNLSLNKIGDTGAQHLAKALHNNKTITKLNLSLNKIGDTGAQHLAEALHNNETITDLNLSMNKIGDIGAHHLAYMLQNNKALTSLLLGIASSQSPSTVIGPYDEQSNRIGYEGAKHLADALQKNKTLTTLDLSDNSIGDVGVKYLSDVLQYNKVLDYTLKILTLSHNNISDIGVQYLANVLQNNATLITLDLRSNQIGDDGAQQLAFALKNNEILIGYWFFPSYAVCHHGFIQCSHLCEKFPNIISSMTNNMLASLETLPIELLYQIFDNLDVETIVVSLRQVCRLFRSVIQTYNRYVFDFQSISKSNFNLICRIVRHENVISLILNNDKTPGQIDFFLSSVRIYRFTRLRSLILRDVDESQATNILTRIKVDQLNSFVIKIQKYDQRRKMTTVKLMTTIISQLHLQKLDIQIESERFGLIKWLEKSTLRDLSINGNMTFHNLCTIMQCSPQLRALTIQQVLPFMDNTNNSICFLQLTSLTIAEIHINIDQLESFLLFTPSLTHLKMIGEINILDGTRWEQFIQIRLPMLDRFELLVWIYHTFPQTLQDIESIIKSFRSLFWIEHKKWFFTCEYDIESSKKIYLYSLPICQTTMKYIPSSQRMSLSTTTTSNLSRMDNVENVILTMTKALADEIAEKETMIMNPVFCKATKLFINLADDWPFIPLISLSVLIDLSHLVEIEFNSCFPITSDTNALSDIINLIQQAHNLSSLLIYSHFAYGFGLCTEDICCLISRQIKHLQIPVDDLNDIKIVLERCNHLSSIQFDIRQRKFSKEIVQWIVDNTIDSTYRTDANFVKVWLGKNKIESNEFNVGFKRMKFSEHC
ncbi:unnamed protein product [Adineta steineri]|nr:unnamed protein product [Adineta steineri]CAF1168924.1 unnamed protein product [Adineta steineri]